VFATQAGLGLDALQDVGAEEEVLAGVGGRLRAQRAGEAAHEVELLLPDRPEVNDQGWLEALVAHEVQGALRAPRRNRQKTKLKGLPGGLYIERRAKSPEYTWPQ